jgi:hypothetical protein
MKLESNQAIKVLGFDPEDVSLRSCHGGVFTWDPPVLNEDGSYTPGAWTPPKDPKLCDFGYHLTDDPCVWWLRNDLRAFLVEYKGKVDGVFDHSRHRKIAVESCRLLRPLTAAELRGFNVFTEGEHVVDVGGRICRVTGNAVVTVNGIDPYVKTVVRTYGCPTVHTKGNVDVYAEGNPIVNANGATVVYAMGGSVVNARDSAFVYAYDKSVVTLYDDSGFHRMKYHMGTITRL